MMAAGNPNWWSLSSSTTDNKAHQQPSAILPPCPSLFPQFVAAGSSNSLPLNSLSDHNNQEFPHSWNQLLMGGLASEEAEKFGQFESTKLENWEEEEQQILNINQSLLRAPVFDNHVKQKDAQSRQLYGSDGDDDHDGFQTSISNTRIPNSWSSSVTTTLSTNTTNILDFSNNKGSDGRNQHTDHSSECNSISSGGVSKRARVHSSSTQPPLKVRKEKLGDRITALHQLVSPFGKTDTASVLLEAIGYIGFLQAQIEALSSPYLGNASANMRHKQSVIHGERGSTFPEDHGQGNEDAPKDLRSRGLCLVPLSCTQHVGSENIGADYWAPALGGGF